MLIYIERNDKIDNECQEKLDRDDETQRLHTYRVKHKDEEKKIIKISDGRLIKNKSKEVKTFWQRIKKIDDNIAMNSTRQDYKVVRSLPRGYQSKTILCKSRSWAAIGVESETQQKWVSYLKELLSPSSQLIHRNQQELWA